MDLTDKQKEELGALYVASLDEKQLKALQIAKEHLKDISQNGTYNMFKSNGFLAWKKKNYPT